MEGKLRFDFSVFYTCIIRKYTKQSQRYVINTLLRGEEDVYDDSYCSKFGSGDRPISDVDILYLQELSDDELLTRVNRLYINSSIGLNTFFHLVDTGYIEWDNSWNNSFSRDIITDKEIPVLIAKLFRYSLNCVSDKIKKLTPKQVKMLQQQIPDELFDNGPDEPISNSFADNYLKTLFWSNSDENTLKNLYVYNTYRFSHQAKSHDDLETLVEYFIDGRLNDFLKTSKGIQQYVPIKILLITAFPGCGKTSLISKLAYDYSKKQHLYFVNMADMKNSIITLATISERLSVSKSKLKHAVLILDSLDEAIKQSDNCDEVLTNLSEEFEEFDIKALITCRSNLLISDMLRSCFEIELQGFDSEKAIEWLEKYHRINSEFPFEKWEYTVSRLDSTLSKVLLIPLILYICVVRKIDITAISDIGQLYDILFDPINGQVALTGHRDYANYKSKEWKVLRKAISDSAIIMHQKGYIAKSDIVNTDMIDLKKYLGIDFYVDVTSEQFRFVHASMWQYFVAECIYNHLKELKSTKDIQTFIDNMLEIIVPQNTIDNLTLEFVNYFMKRENWKPANANLYKHILFHISDYNITKTGNILTIISTLWRDLFKIFTHIFKHYYPNMMDTFFEDSFSEKSSDILIRCSNLTEESPIQNISGYRLKEITMNGINFSKTYMRFCSLRFSTFRNANFEEAGVSGIYADGCDMTGSSFCKASLHNANFFGATLVACDFKNAKLNGANFINANLSYADLRNAVLQKTYFDNAILDYCKISLKHLDFFNLELIAATKIAVYDEKNNLMTYEQLYEYYYSKHPVAKAFREYAESLRKEQQK